MARRREAKTFVVVVLCWVGGGEGGRGEGEGGGFAEVVGLPKEEEEVGGFGLAAVKSAAGSPARFFDMCYPRRR